MKTCRCFGTEPTNRINEVPGGGAERERGDFSEN